MDNKLISGKTNKKAIFSDFDGTLSSIRISPREATINLLSKKSLTKLKKEYTVGIISGRPIDNIRQIAGIKGIYYVGNHGAEIYNNGDLFIFNKAYKAAPLIKTIASDLKRHLKRPFSLDFKNFSASIHYRKHPNPAYARQSIMAQLSKYNKYGILEFNDGRMVVEIRVKGINKAEALKKIIEQEKIEDFIYFGDDRTDLDIFDMAQPKHFNIAVKNPETDNQLFEKADLILNNTNEVAQMLGALAGKIR